MAGGAASTAGGRVGSFSGHDLKLKYCVDISFMV
jgi:hypothetical protein